MEFRSHFPCKSRCLTVDKFLSRCEKDRADDENLECRNKLNALFLTTREEFINEFYRKFDCKIPPMNLVILDKMCDDMAMKSMKCKARRECPEHYEEIDGHQCVDSSSTR